MKINQDVSSVIIDIDGIIEKDDYLEVNMDNISDINNIRGVSKKDNENMMIIHIYVEDTVFYRMSSTMLEHFSQ